MKTATEPQREHFTPQEIHQATELAQDLLNLLKRSTDDGPIALLAVAMVGVTGISNTRPVAGVNLSEAIADTHNWFATTVLTRVSPAIERALADERKAQMS